MFCNSDGMFLQTRKVRYLLGCFYNSDGMLPQESLKPARKRDIQGAHRYGESFPRIGELKNAIWAGRRSAFEPLGPVGHYFLTTDLRIAKRWGQ
jgi:hypothetical protein